MSRVLCCGVWCVVCGVWCDTLEKNRVSVQKRPRVYRHRAHTCFNMFVRGAGTHGDVLDGHTGGGKGGGVVVSLVFFIGKTSDLFDIC